MINSTNNINSKIKNHILLIRKILELGPVSGQTDLIYFLKLTWKLDEMPNLSGDSRCSNATDDIRQHMNNFPDWSEKELFIKYLEVQNQDDSIFFQFLKNIVDPSIRDGESEQNKYVKTINEHLSSEGFKLQEVCEDVAGKHYEVRKIGSGVKGDIKNIIFASNGSKPKIIINDALNNDIKITENAEFCLIYDLPINNGLYWNNLIEWWKKKENISELNEAEKSLYTRLYNSLCQKSPAEKLFFKTYFRKFIHQHDKNLPALIPQVYLHYDPYTLKKEESSKLFRQRMDFLMLLSKHERIVIEIDGIQHYSDAGGNNNDFDGNDRPRADCKKYSEMLAEDRKLRLAGYELYRFGGYELKNSNNPSPLIEEFFQRLFNKHNISLSNSKTNDNSNIDNDF